jgi:hypothetical protein
MFHNHTTERRIYITADKLTFKQVVPIDHPLISRQTAVPQQCMTPTSAPKLQMLLAALVSTKCQSVEGLVSTKSQAVEAAKCCQTQGHAGHETARIAFRPPNTVSRLL